MAWRADRVCLNVRTEEGSAEPAGGLDQQLSAQRQQLVVQCASNAVGRIPLGVLFGQGTKHHHQGAMGVLAVGEGVIEGNAQWLSVHL